MVTPLGTLIEQNLIVPSVVTTEVLADTFDLKLVPVHSVEPLAVAFHLANNTVYVESYTVLESTAIPVYVCQPSNS